MAARRRPDPVFAAIAAHREALADFGPEAAFLWKKRRETELRDLRHAYQAQTDKLVATEIKTRAGLRAFADYIASLQAYGGGKSAPCTYAIEVWHLSDAMAAVSEAMSRLIAPKRRPVRVPASVGAVAPALLH